MPSSRFGAGIRVGTVAAAATIGAVIGLGLRHGLALRPFSTAGRALLATLGDADASAGAAAVVGLVVVAIAIILLGVCFTFVAAPLRGVRLVGVAIVFAAIGWAVSVYVVPSILVLSAEIVLGTAQRVFICALLALSLVVGMRLARQRNRIE
ncbi:MAG TPA: hypothetical protein VFZ21_00050 [Gemmatimonadaceae bacterium]|jgi:hypothetical protein|nr:hypothetical protein [Gemmatimonadaceae bacterium]